MGRPFPGEDAGAQSLQVKALSRTRRWLTALLVLLCLMTGMVVWLVANARAMPVVRRLDVVLPFPADAPRRPITVALLTDSHLSGPDNSPARMARIVALVNGLKPDLIALGGDYIGDNKGGATYDPAHSIAPFAGLRAGQSRRPKTCADQPPAMGHSVRPDRHPSA